MRHASLALLLAAGLTTFACSADTRTIPGGNTPRGGGGDTGVHSDAESPDFGFDDSGQPIDGGVPVENDTGVPAESDSGTPITPDSGPPIDAGFDDAGQPIDTGPPADTGVPIFPDAQVIPPDTGVAAPDLQIRFASAVPMVVRAGGTLTLALEAANRGTAGSGPTEVQLDIYARAAGPGAATMLSRVGVRSLGAGESERLSVSVALPTSLSTGPYVIRARIDPGSFVSESNESNNEVAADVRVPGIELTPALVDFGDVTLGCSSVSATVAIENLTGVDATITGIAIVGTPELGVLPVPLPARLAAGQRLVFTVTYSPMDVGPDGGRLDLTVVQGSPATMSVTLAGAGVQAATRTDTFTQTSMGVPRVDILLIVDNSCSMSEEQRNLSMQFEPFARAAQAAGLDWQIAVTTTDTDPTGAQGRFVPVTGTGPRILTPTTPNVAQAFAAAVNQGTMGSGTERGLEASYLALTPPLIGTHNAGFLRPDASLTIIYLSDEEDSSTRTLQTYESTFRALKPAGLVRVNAIVGTSMTQGGCMGPGGSAIDYGSRYIAMVNAFGGTAVSICSADWSPAFTTLGPTLTSRFVLTRAARPNTIEVRVNGMVIPQMAPGGGASWSFDGNRTISFHGGAVPPAGATIEIRYVSVC